MKAIKRTPFNPDILVIDVAVWSYIYILLLEDYRRRLQKMHRVEDSRLAIGRVLKMEKLGGFAFLIASACGIGFALGAIIQSDESRIGYVSLLVVCLVVYFFYATASGIRKDARKDPASWERHRSWTAWEMAGSVLFTICMLATLVWKLL